MKALVRRKRLDIASRLIKVSPQAIYSAFLDPKSVAVWRAPEGMTCKIDRFEPKQDGHYRMTLTYEENSNTTKEKAETHADIIHGQFLAFLPGKLLIELVFFESSNPAFSNAMTITVLFTEKKDGTEVAFLCENVPETISIEQHQQEMHSTLAKLAKFTENLIQ